METTVRRLSKNLRIAEEQHVQLPSMTVMLQRVSTMNLTDQYHIQLMDTNIQIPPLDLCSMDESIILNVSIDRSFLPVLIFVHSS